MSAVKAIQQQTPTQFRGPHNCTVVTDNMLQTLYPNLVVLCSCIDQGKQDGGHLANDNEENCASDTVKTLYKNAQYFFLKQVTFTR